MEERAHGVAHRQVVRVDLEAPRQRRRATEQLLVKPVAPSADRLGDQQGGCQRVSDGPESDVGSFDRDERAERAQGDATPDAEAAAPDLKGQHRVPTGAEVGLGRGHDVVEARANDAQRDRPQGRVVDRVGIAPARNVATRGPPHADDHSDGDDDAVRAQRHGADIPHALGG